MSTEAPTESSDGFGQINYKSTFGEIAGSFRPQSSLGSRRVEDAARSRAPVTSGTGMAPPTSVLLSAPHILLVLFPGGDVALKFSEPLLGML